MTISNLKTNTAGSINYDFLDALTDEIKSVSYMISAIGDSVFSTGLPSDPEVFNVTMAKLSERLDEVAETLDAVKEDLADEDPEQSE